MNDEEKKEVKLTPEQIKLLPFYYDLKNSIIEPDKIVVSTQYFWDNWVPLLGPTLSVLIIRLRRYCYYNKITKEKRDWCYPDQIKLAKEIGVSADTVQRELNRDIAKHFVTRKSRYIYNETLKKKVRASDIYYIAMDDPLMSEDENKLAVMAAERILSQHMEKQQIIPKCQNDTQVKEKSVNTPPKPQNAVQVSKKDINTPPPKPQNGTYIYKPQNAVANVSTIYNTNNVNNVDKKQSFTERILNSKAKVECLVEDMIIELEDIHSKGFFKKVAELCPETLIYRALAEVKEEYHMGKIKKSKGACFTDKIKRLAKEAGIIVAKK
jgi:hypothetical protein